MEMTISQQQGRVLVTVFSIQGDIDSSTYEQIQAQVNQTIDAGARNVVFDLTQVRHMSSAGMRLLNNVFNRLRGDLPEESDEAMKKGVRDGTFKSPHVKLVNPAPRVLEVLKTTGLDIFLAIYQTVTEAVASF